MLSFLSHNSNLVDGMMCHFYLFGSNSLAESGTFIKFVPELPHSIPILNRQKGTANFVYCTIFHEQTLLFLRINALNDSIIQILRQPKTFFTFSVTYPNLTRQNLILIFFVVFFFLVPASPIDKHLTASYLVSCKT